MAIKDELKAIELELQDLSDKKQKLLDQQQALQRRKESFYRFMDEMGYKRPAELINDAAELFEVTPPASSAKKKRKPRTTITESMRNEIRTRIEAGSPLKEIADEYGVSYGAVSKIKRTGE